jgi:hypothetical protein
MVNHVKRESGIAHIRETLEGDMMVRAAVLTVTIDESRNLECFGDIIFLDGTMIRNELEWTIFPVTLVHECNRIMFDGLLLTVFEQTKVFH